MKSSRSYKGINPSLASLSGEIRTVLEEDCFHRMMSLERKRTERSRRPFLLMLLDVGAILTADKTGRVVGKLLSALSMSLRETDIVGWYKNNSAAGILFTEIADGLRKSIASTMLTRVSGILYGNLSFEQFSQVSISSHLFPEEWDHDVPQRPSQPRLYPDVSSRENGTKFFTVMKRMMDVIGSALGLLISAPLFLGIAMAIKLSSRGPVFFRQQRVGRYGTPFVFLKFRSMFTDSDASVHKEYVRQLIAGQAEPKPSNGNTQGVYKLTADARVTRLGAFLRRTSLDELPQLFNVLKGEMSLVGPRPAIAYEVEAYEIWHRRRVLEAKPGITGLWQVNGRSRVKFDAMVRLDVRYAIARSLWLDIKILMLTPRAVLFGEGAY